MTVILLALLFLTSVRAPAQENTVTLTAAEFQRLVYSAHLNTQMNEKPELEACVQALLELHRRNPNANPTALADLSRQALQHYRANAPAYVRTNGSRDEIFAAYLGALRQVPTRTNFIPANLQLLNGFMLQPHDYANTSPAELIHSGNQRLLASSGESAKRQALGEACMVRAQGDAAFATAVDTLLWPEAPISVHDTPAAIIGNTNSGLHDNFTMQTLLALSAASGNGSLTISSNTVKWLFGKEMEVLWEAVHTNRLLLIEFNQSEPDLLAYLTNQPARDLWETRLAATRQTRNIASSTAAILVQSQLTAAPESSFKVPEWVGPVADTVGGLAKLFIKGDPSALISSMGGLIGLFDDSESPDEQIVREIGNIQTMMGDLSTNMNYRFDRVDQSLTTIFETLNEEFGKIEISLGQITHLNGTVDDIRANLVDVQTDLHCLERHLLAYVNQLYGRGLNLDFNYYLGYEATYGVPMTYAGYGVPESHFFTHARNNSVDGLSAPYQDRNYTAQGLLDELTESVSGATNRLDQNLSYIKKYLNDVLGQPTAGTLGELANPRDWFVGAYSYAQLALENPGYFRQVNPTNRLDLIAARGRDLTNFFRSLTFSGPNINSQLYNALNNHYASNLIAFDAQVSVVESNYASAADFALRDWRQWSTGAPRLNALTTAVLAAPGLPLGSGPSEPIAAGFGHTLLLRTNGTVEGWGYNKFGQATIPFGLSNVVAVAAGHHHSLALTTNGTVVGWGDNSGGQTSVPAGLANLIAVAGGGSHSLALKNNGTVVSWGNNSYGQTNVPSGLTNVVRIAAGANHSLALDANGIVVGWGATSSGQTSIPAGLSNVVEIAAGNYHNLAVRADGTVVGWGGYPGGQTNIPTGLSNVVAIAAGSAHSLALKADGTVVAWGESNYGSTNVPSGLSNVVAIAAGYEYSLARKADGTLVGWGFNRYGHVSIPGSLSNAVAMAAGDVSNLALKADGTVASWGTATYDIPIGLSNAVAIAAGGSHSLALRKDGTVEGWGDNRYGQLNVPTGLSDVVAIAAGNYHNLALRSDGTVTGWGITTHGELDIPAGLTNVVAIAASSSFNGFNLALRADGTVVGWGDNYYGQTTAPAGLGHVVAIAAGGSHSLALRSDGTVVGWGDNYYGQATAPVGLGTVVAIAAGGSHSLALRSDGTVVGWGNNNYCQTNIPRGLSNVVAIAAGNVSSLFLRAADAGGSPASGSWSFGQIPSRVSVLLQACNQNTIDELGRVGALRSAALGLSGSKALLTAVLELGLPYTLERDDVLHGFLYGSDSLADLDTARIFLEAQNVALHASLKAPFPTLTEVAVLRYQRFTERLTARLDNLQASGQPELPRLVGHTLHLLNLLRDAWTQPVNSPPPALELWSESGSLRLLLYGEPYTRYTLQYRENLEVPGWNATTFTNWRNEEIISPPVSTAPQRFYRSLLPTQ